MHESRIRVGFILAGLYNLGIILFSRGFSDALGSVDPLFGSEGSFLILLWGLAYLGTRSVYASAPLLVGVFCIEKLFYFQHWVQWLMEEGDSLSQLWASDPLTAMFYAIYGFGDALFAVFFGVVAWSHRAQS